MSRTECNYVFSLEIKLIVESGELPDLNAGDHIRIVFDGIIKESYPLQLGNVFAIYLLDENGNL